MRSRSSIGDRFRRAKAFVQQGWVQGTVKEYWDADKFGVCALGAMMEADGVCDHVDEELASIFARVNYIGTGREDVARWNDDHRRKKEDVVEAFERAACYAEGDRKMELVEV